MVANDSTTSRSGSDSFANHVSLAFCHTMRCMYCCRWLASCVEQTLGRISQVSIKASHLQAAHRQVPQAKARRANGGSKPGTFGKSLQEVILTDSDCKTRAPGQTGLSPWPAVAGPRKGKTSCPYSTRRPSFHPATWRPAAVALAAAVWPASRAVCNSAFKGRLVSFFFTLTRLPLPLIVVKLLHTGSRLISYFRLSLETNLRETPELDAN